MAVHAMGFAMLLHMPMSVYIPNNGTQMGAQELDSNMASCEAFIDGDPLSETGFGLSGAPCFPVRITCPFRKFLAKKNTTTTLYHCTTSPVQEPHKANEEKGNAKILQTAVTSYNKECRPLIKVPASYPASAWASVERVGGKADETVPDKTEEEVKQFTDTKRLQVCKKQIKASELNHMKQGLRVTWQGLDTVTEENYEETQRFVAKPAGVYRVHRRVIEDDDDGGYGDAAAAAAAGPAAGGAWRDDVPWAAPSLRDGQAFPRLVYGTAWKGNQTAGLVLSALAAGFRGFDTACQPRHYNESLVGDALRQSPVPREQLYVQTKFTPPGGQDPDNTPYDRNASIEEQVRQSWDATLRNLGSAPDAWLMHSPHADFNDTLRAWRAMEAVAGAQPRPPALGMSNLRDEGQFAELFDKAKMKPVVLQNKWVADFGHDTSLRRLLRKKGVIYQSFWTLTGNRRVLQGDAVLDAARRTRRTPQQVLLRYCVDRGITPLIGAKSPDHIRESLDVLGDPPLTPDELAAIDAALAAEAEEKDASRLLAADTEEMRLSLRLRLRKEAMLAAEAERNPLSPCDPLSPQLSAPELLHQM